MWSTKGVEGVHRFLARVYRLVTEGGGLTEEEPTRDQLRLLHQTIKKVGGGVFCGTAPGCMGVDWRVSMWG